MTVAGLGCQSAQLVFHLANRPPLEPYQSLRKLQPMVAGEIEFLSRTQSNHWRKAFNVLAKFYYQLQGSPLAAPLGLDAFASWQDYRDQRLLRQGSQTALLFSAPDFGARDRIHIIAGKTYAADLGLPFSLNWHDQFFAINVENRLIVSPYLDYRQLSNARINLLAELVLSLHSKQ